MPTEKSFIDEISFLYSEGNSMPMIAEQLNVSVHKVQYWLEKENIGRRRPSEATTLAYIKRFNKIPCKIKIDSLDIEQERLLISGVMLYWAEGSKKNNNYVAFSNSDPEMVRLFLSFLRGICGVQESRLHLLLHIYTDQNEKELKNFWSEITKIPSSQFNKTYIHQGKVGNYKKKSQYGTISLRYGDKKLFDQIIKWIREYKNLLNYNFAEVAQ